MKKHLTQILLDNGYKTYRFGCTFPDQNASAKEQYRIILKNRKDMIYVNGTNEGSERKYFFYPHGAVNDFSTMVVGGIDIRFVKNLDFENQIIWGLSEFGKPPTLKWPRPTIRVKRSFNFGEVQHEYYENESIDNSMNLCLEKEDHEAVFKAIFDRTIKFEYDLTK